MEQQPTENRVETKMPNEKLGALQGYMAAIATGELTDLSSVTAKEVGPEGMYNLKLKLRERERKASRNDRLGI